MTASSTGYSRLYTIGGWPPSTSTWVEATAVPKPAVDFSLGGNSPTAPVLRAAQRSPIEVLATSTASSRCLDFDR